MDELTIRQKLNIVQSELKVGKDQKNDFGHYKYRSCGDILEALKPFIAKYGFTVTSSYKVVAVLDRVYMECTTTITDNDEVGGISVVAYAREPEHRKGMDESQISGSSESYSQKYALASLFGIDDTKDADTMDNSKLGVKKEPVAQEDKLVTAYDITTFLYNAKKFGWDGDDLRADAEFLGYEKPGGMTKSELDALKPKYSKLKV